MEIFLFTAKDAFLPGTDCRYNYITSFKDYTTPHTHEFFEFFVITEGKIVHRFNNSSRILQEGSIVLIRPSDIHYYEKYQEYDCKWINITFSKKVFSDLELYLGQDFSWERLLNLDVPPHLQLSRTEKNLLVRRLEKLNLLPISQKSVIGIEFRSLLVDMFTRYFNNINSSRNELLPLWLSNLCELMSGKENFVRGLDAMKELSGKAHEHLCRLFKQHLSCTPTEYINGLKLNYAANLLANSDMEILDISLESGFNNLSHFYHLFKKEFGISPMEFRKMNHRELLM